MPTPAHAFYGNSNVGDAGNTNETVAGVSWLADDWVFVLGSVSNNDAANQLATPTVTGLSGTGLTFSLVTSVNNSATVDGAQLFLWSAKAAGNGSGTIQSVSTAPAGQRCCIAVYGYRNCRGIGTPVTLDSSAAKTVSLGRTLQGSHVIAMLVDWLAVGDVVVDATPTGTVHLASAQAALSDFFALRWADQGAPATTSYGVTNHTGTVSFSAIAVEILGNADPTADSLKLLDLAYWKPQRWDFPIGTDLLLDDFFPSAGGAQNIAVGLATSTNNALAVGKRKSKTVGLASSSNTALVCRPRRLRPVGLASSANTALACARRKAKTLGLCSSANTALAVVAPKNIAVGITTSSNTAFAATHVKRRALGLATETDTALPVTAPAASGAGGIGVFTEWWRRRNFFD